MPAMIPEQLMSLLSDRPPCCAGLRAAATERIVELEKKVEGLEVSVSILKGIIHEFGVVDGGARLISTSAYEGDVESRCRNWRGLHIAHGGLLFEAAADEIKRLRLTDEEQEAVRWFSGYGD